jgi:hypothetical protein
MEQAYNASKEAEKAALTKENKELRAAIDEQGQALAYLVSEMLESGQISSDLAHAVLEKGKLHKYLSPHGSQPSPKPPATEKTYPGI